jgi:hypothetical protein
VPEIPDTIVLRRHRDLVGRRHEIWFRRSLLALLAAVLALGLADLLGQSPTTDNAGADAATLTIVSPSSIRGGLMYQTRFDVHAKRELKKATLVLDKGWLQGLTINTIEPSPLGEGSRDGSLVLELGHIAAGDVYSLYIQYQVNPTTVGRRNQVAELADSGKTIFRVHRKLTVFP